VDIAFILVEPKRGENVGAAARALKTMGFRDLRLVGEPLQHSPGARALAHGAGDILDAASTYPSLATALEDIDFAIGTSAKDRRHRRRHYNPADVSALLQQKLPALKGAAMVFGREDYGLSNTEIALCDVVSQVPLAAAYPSLNLAQAVMVYAYALGTVSAEQSSEPGDARQYRALKPKIDQLLGNAGITRQEKTYLWAMQRLAEASAEDLGFLHFICDKISQKSGAKTLQAARRRSKLG
jgi:tRNA/rRNA methyltransferase